MDYDLERFANRRRRQRRVFRPRINMDNYYFVNRFRMTQYQVHSLVNRLADQLRRNTLRNHALSPQQQVLITLRFLADGGSFRLIGDAHGVSPASVSRCLHSVITAINTAFFDEEIQFPDGQELFQLPQAFQQVSGSQMPSVCGIVDGTHVRIKSPTENEEQFVNRHDQHSLNVMLVCGPNLKIFYCSSRWPGSVHDSRILRNSSLTEAFDGNLPFRKAIVLGDSGYALSEWLITPIAAPQNDVEYRFNVHHKRMRRLIECCNGVLKQRFRCLMNTLQFEPVFCAEIIKACCILHNLIINSRQEDFELPDNVNEEDNFPVVPNQAPNQRRRELLRYFNNLP